MTRRSNDDPYPQRLNMSTYKIERKLFQTAQIWLAGRMIISIHRENWMFISCMHEKNNWEKTAAQAENWEKTVPICIWMRKHTVWWFLECLVKEHSPLPWVQRVKSTVKLQHVHCVTLRLISRCGISFKSSSHENGRLSLCWCWKCHFWRQNMLASSTAYLSSLSLLRRDFCKGVGFFNFYLRGVQVCVKWSCLTQ